MKHLRRVSLSVVCLFVAATVCAQQQLTVFGRSFDLQPIAEADYTGSHGKLYVDGTFTSDAGVGLEALTTGKPSIVGKLGGSAGAFRFLNASGTELMRINADGRIGVGSAGPSAKFVLVDETTYSAMMMLFAHAEPARFQAMLQLDSGTTGRPALRFGTYFCGQGCGVAGVSDEVFYNTLVLHRNKVGINVPNPDATLAVGGTFRIHNETNTLKGLRVGAELNGFPLNGTSYDEVTVITPINVGPNNARSAVYFRSATSGSNRNDLDVVVDGNIAAKYQDVAEWVPATHDLAPGTVVVLDPRAVNRVMPSHAAYDTAVAGVVSAKPGLILGEAAADKEQIATTGRVKVKVDATAHAIAVGDLLVTSDKPGTAMYSAPLDLAGVKLHRPGTILGKALEPLAAGEGEILVLLSMQ